MSKNDGGPAYPAPEAAKARFGDFNPDAYLGMSLRDYFAAKAMQAMLSAPIGKFSHVAFSDVSGSAYAMADEMLKEREK